MVFEENVQEEYLPSEPQQCSICILTTPPLVPKVSPVDQGKKG
jgi:hypothetical protein